MLGPELRNTLSVLRDHATGPSNFAIFSAITKNLTLIEIEITAPQIFTGDTVITASKSVPNNEATPLAVLTAGEI